MTTTSKPSSPTNNSIAATNPSSSITGSKNDESKNKDSTTAASSNVELEPEAVIEFLRKRGLGTLALELERKLETDSHKKAKTSKDDNNDKIEMMDIDKDEYRREIERKVEEAHENKSVLHLATGGGMGYDLDTAAELLLWGEGTNVNKVHIQENKNNDDENNDEEKDQEESTATNKNDPPDHEYDQEKQYKDAWNQNEGKRYIRAFTALQTWVLTLPNDDNGNYSHATTDSVLHHAKVHAGFVDASNNCNHENDITSVNNDTAMNNNEKENNDQNGTTSPEENTNLQSETKVTTTHVIPANNATITTNKARQYQASLTPKSIKPELLSFCFPLLVHTYCQLLQFGLEQNAHALLSTYRHIHEPYHPEEFLDLDKCSTQSEIKRLTSLIKGYNDSISKAKHLKTMREKYDSDLTSSLSNNNTNNNPPSAPGQQQQQQIIGRIKQIDNQYKEIVAKHADCQNQLKSYPFLKRARSVKWHIHFSALTFQMLARFFHSGDDGGVELLPMIGIAQSYCHLIVENRDPVPFVPGFILEGMLSMDGTTATSSDSNGNEGGANLIQDDDKVDGNDNIKWAAPVDITSRLLMEGEDTDNVNSILKSSERPLPFPEYFLKPQYATLDDYEKHKREVAFNRAVLTNGFRRFEALEAKREYGVGIRVKDGWDNKDANSRSLFGNPMEPSIMFSTICASSSKVHNNRQGGGPQQCTLNRSSIDLTCAKLCLPDGRHVAAGCSDSAIRIWSMKSLNTYNGKSTVDSSDGVSPPRESTIILHGHKQGLPVYAVDWNRDGRTLLSAGGDGTVRLWDSGAVGPFGKLASVTKRSTKISNTMKRSNKTTHREPNTHVPGAKPQSMVEKHGAALACYKGHSRSTPIWSVAMAPCGYYFASAGSDSTARLWCTDRPTPVRIFIGHHSQNVNCLSWHPNCNYLLSGSDDKSIRMWDVQSGRCVRILSGCKFGVNQVKVSPSGQYVAGADYGGTVSIWDIRNGRKVKEFQHESQGGRTPPIIYTLSFSPCGSTIATGGDDCTIRIWDARGMGNNKHDPEYAASIGWGIGSNILANTTVQNQSIDGRNEPVKTFYSCNSIVLDLEFTKRNLLLSVGKYTP